MLKLFVGGLSRETSDVALKEYFSKYGAVVECVVAQDRDTGSPRGFGFVTFSDSAAFDGALGDCHVILERRVDVKRAIPRSEQLRNQQPCLSNSHGTSNNIQFKSKKIFVGGLSSTLTQNEFKSYFEKFGRITDIVLMHDKVSNRPRGFGFITFDSEEAVEDVTRISFHSLGGKLVEVKRAVPKEVAGNNHYPILGNDIGSFNNYHYGYYTPYPYSYMNPLGPFCPSFSGLGFYGLSYGAQTSPMSPFHYGFGSMFYPTYMNGGVGVMGPPNGMYSYMTHGGACKDLSGHGNGNGQVEVNVSSAQVIE